MLQAIDLQGQVVYGQTDIFVYAGSSGGYVLGRAARAGRLCWFVDRQSEGTGSPQEFRPVGDRIQAVSALREGQGISARPRLPRSTALSMPPSVAGRLRTHLQRKDGHTVHDKEPKLFVPADELSSVDSQFSTLSLLASAVRSVC